jgi:hypothetical protein
MKNTGKVHKSVDRLRASKQPELTRLLLAPSSRTQKCSPAAEFCMPDRRAEAVKEDGGKVESNSHLHELGRYNRRLGDRC